MASSIFNCFQCKSPFNLAEKSPKILPCNNTICLSCLRLSERSISGFRVECTCEANEQHNINDISQLYPCQLITNYLKTQHLYEGPIDNLKKQLDITKFSLNGAKFEASRHYDEIEMDIEIQAETLIALIHEKRDQLLESTKTYRNQTESHFDLISDQQKQLYTELDDNFDKTIKDGNLNDLVCGFNKVQRPIDAIKSNIYQFVPNQNVLDSSLLGLMLNRAVDLIYTKITNLNQLLNTPTHVNILDQTLNTKIHRHYIVPMTQERTISIYFTSERSINLELFDESNTVIKTYVLTTTASYYPIFSSTSERLVVCYLDDRSRTNVVLFDTELNQLKSTTVTNLVESVFVNKHNVVCTFVHKSAQCCQVFDMELEVVGTFGQKQVVEEPFYMTMIEDKMDFRAKKNATIFGLNEERIYFYNTTDMVIMCRKSGAVLETIKKRMNSYFILDSTENVIEIDAISKEIVFRSSDLIVTGSNRYQCIATDVYLVEDMFLVFVDPKKRSLTFV